MPNYVFCGINIFSKNHSKKRKNNKVKKGKIIFLIIVAILITVVVLGSFYIKKYSEVAFNFSSGTEREEKKEILNSEIKNFGIKIKKIDVAIPVIENVDGAEKEIYNKELQKGVAHLKGSALPGEGDNIFIFGHSSSFPGSGPYSKIFAELNNLQVGDKIIVFYKGEQYNYFVFEKEIVDKGNVSVAKSTNEEQLTLMTCWPIGTKRERLVIKAKILE